MNKSEALKFQEEHDNEYLTDNWPNRFRRGLEILEKYLENVELFAYHDVINIGYIGDDSDYREDDILDLRKLGFGVSDEHDCFYYFT